jgi:predicted acyl esterase
LRAATMVTCLLGWVFLSSLAPAQSTFQAQILTSDSIRLDATICLPAGPSGPHGFPGVILVHGYGGNKEQMSDMQLVLTTLGYASLAYSVRGQGNSQGLSSVAGDRERQDLLEVVNYFRFTAGVDSNNLCVAGGSQGGIHSWMAAIYRMPGVRTVMPLFATPDFAQSLVPNGSIRTALSREMTLATVRYGPDRDRVKEFIIADNYDSVLVYIKQRDLASLVSNVRIPVLQVLGWADVVFPVNGGIDARGELATRGVPIRSYFGTNGHGLPVNLQEIIDLFSRTTQWINRWLRDSVLAQDSLPLVMYADDKLTEVVRTTTVWPPLNAFNGRFYLSPGTLSAAPPSNSVPTVMPFTVIYDSTYTPRQAWDDRYGGSRFVAAFADAPARFVSDPLASSVEISGTPAARIFVRGDREKYQVHLRFFDVAENGGVLTWTLFSRSVNTNRNAGAQEVRTLAAVGTSVSHRLLAGHRLGLEVTSLDMEDALFAHTIPLFASSRVELLTSAGEASYIEFGSPTSTAVNSKAQIPSLPFALEQNFPNPFNPRTVIGYQLSVARKMTIAVYDLLGREVEVLVNEFKQPGRYEVLWKAEALPSGVYLCRMHAGDFISTRKLVLLK